jgi:MerR family transcriptional regulator, copper efflux regulator
MQAQPFLDPSTPDQQESFTISQVARMTGITAKAIRYYESIGLLPPPMRRPNQYRRYDMADINRLILLRRIRFLGVPLTEAKVLLHGATQAPRSQVQQDLLDLVQLRLAALDREIAELHLLRTELEQYQQKLASCHPDEQEPFCTSVDLSCIVVGDRAICNEMLS